MVHIFALLVLQTSGKVGPMVAPGVSLAFHQNVLKVEQALEKQDFDGANNLLKSFPKKSIRVSWDASKVPAAKQELYTKGRDAALAQWQKKFPDLKVELSDDNPDIKFSFEPLLAVDPVDKIPAGSAQFLNPETGKLEVVIGMSRGQSVDSTDNDISNDVSRALGAYYGLDNDDNGVSIMRVYNAGAGLLFEISAVEAFTVKANLDVQSKLQLAVDGKTPMSQALPAVVFDPNSVKVNDSVQGDLVPVTIQVSNTGNAPLSMRIVPDCGCVVSTSGETIPPGASRLIKSVFNSAQYSGDIHKVIRFYTNDPEKPRVEIPLDFKVDPLYELINVEQVRPAIGKDIDTSFMLAVNPRASFNVLGVLLQNSDGYATLKPIKDIPGANGKARRGYKIGIHVPAPKDFGQFLLSVKMPTDQPNIDQIVTTIPIQRGIWTNPGSVYLGMTRTDEPKKAKVVLKNALKGFKVLNVSADRPHFEAKLVSQSAKEAVVEISYDGKAYPGNVAATVTITTDDPNQKKIAVAVAVIQK